MKKVNNIGNYVFPQPTLIRVANHMVENMYRDQVEFAKLGITTARFDEITNLAKTLSTLPTDTDVLANLKDARKMRNQTLTDLVQLIDEIALIIEAAFGKQTSEYAKINFASVRNKANIAHVIAHAEHIYSVLTTDEQFADFELPGEYMENLTAKSSKLTADDNAATQLAINRKVITKQRIVIMNTLYLSVATMSSIGKRIWQSTEIAKYDSYVLQKAASNFLSRKTTAA